MVSVQNMAARESSGYIAVKEDPDGPVTVTLSPERDDMAVKEKKRTKSTDKDESEETDRGTWTNKFDFIMSAVSFAVGMGNIWRFPYMCYRNGGGAFLIPYIIMVIFIGIPLMFMELALGQYGSLGVVSIWRAVPIFQGIGWTMFSISFISTMYYNMLQSYSFFYLFASFARDVPWRDCGNEWNTPACGGLLGYMGQKNCTQHNGTWFNSTCYGSVEDLPVEGVQQLLNATNATELQPKTAADEYFHHYMLGISAGLEDMGVPRWQLVLCLLLCWILVFICLSRGIKSFGKATYVTSLFPYVILVILLIRGLTLEGSVTGIVYYLKPNFSTLLSAKVWGDAAIQVFYSMSICWGGLITLASYNKFNNNCLRDAIVVAVGDCLTSIFGGVVIFAILGYMAHELGVPVGEVATQGAGLAFIVYPSAVTRLPISPLWAILFMLMLLNLGFGTQFTLVTTAHTTLLDVFAKTLRKGRRPLVLLLALCSICFLVGLSMTTPGGMYVLQLMDTYAPSYGLVVIGLVETLALSWVYGLDRFNKDIESMLGSKPGYFWTICWRFITPALILSILLFTFADFKPSSYGTYTFPVWADILGWAIALVEIAFIPGVAIYKICSVRSQTPLTITERIRLVSRPASSWGPAKEVVRRIRTVSETSVTLNELRHRKGDTRDETTGETAAADSNGGLIQVKSSDGLLHNGDAFQGHGVNNAV